MKVVTDPTIQGMSGRFPKSRIVMNHREGKTITHARSYVVPDNATQTALFTERIQAVIACYAGSESGFVEDLAKYVAQYNQQIVGDDKLPLSKYSIFIKACFAAAEETSFDIATLTVANFESGLLDAAGDTVIDLITTASLPLLGFVAVDLANPITVA